MFCWIFCFLLVRKYKNKSEKKIFAKQTGKGAVSSLLSAPVSSTHIHTHSLFIIFIRSHRQTKQTSDVMEY